MIFPDNFFENLPDDLIKSIKLICGQFYTYLELETHNIEEDYYEDFLEAYAALEAFIQAHKLESEFNIPKLSSDKKDNQNKINQFYEDANSRANKIIAANHLEAQRFKFRAQLGSVFSYKFSDGDLIQIQKTINELRDLINNSNLFDANHKERLLVRLENLQKELHKKMSNLDKFWGLIGDAGVVLGKLGNDAKPFVDRIKEIAEIVWRTQASAEELPSGIPMPMLNKENK